MSKKSQRLILPSQGKEIICRVYDFMKKEATTKHAANITKACWRTAQAVGVSEKTVSRILQERRVHQSKHEMTQVIDKPEISINIVPCSDHDYAIVAKSDPKMEGNSEDSSKMEVTSEDSSSANSICKCKAATIFREPNKNRKPKKPKYDDITISTTKNIIENHFMEHNSYPSLLELNTLLREQIQFKGSISTLRRFLRKAGCYKYSKTESKETQSQLK